jgi:hypothetical protein
MKTYKYVISSFPTVPFLNRFDHWNGLATHRTISTTISLTVIRRRFHSLAFSAVLASTPPEPADCNKAVKSVQGATYFCLEILLNQSERLHFDLFCLDYENPNNPRVEKLLRRSNNRMARRDDAFTTAFPYLLNMKNLG